MGALLQFPDRARGRKRQRKSIGAMGDCSLMLIRDDPFPKNVDRFAYAKPSQQRTDDGELSILLATAIFAVLPKDAKVDLLDQLRVMDLGRKDSRAAQVLAIIDRGRH